MSVRFWIPGPLPGLNEVIAACKGSGGRGYAYAKLKKQWTENICWLAKAAQVAKVVTYRLDILWVEPIHKNGAQRDRDNIEGGGVKFLNDGLKLAKIIPDDKPANYLGSTHHHAQGAKPGAWVTVIESVA
jgi:hypothetical protein